MKVVVQRVLNSSVIIDDKYEEKINKGLMILLGMTYNDGIEDIDYLVNKILNLRIFEKDNKMNLSVKDINGDILLIPQFTLYANPYDGNRPSFNDALNKEEAEKLFFIFKKKIRSIYYKLLNALIALTIIYVLFLLRGLWGGVFVKILAILKPFIIAFVIAYAFYPFLRWLQNKKWPKGLAVAFIVLLTVAFLGFIIYSLIPVFSEQLVSLFSSIITFVTDVGTKFDIDISPIRTTLYDVFNKISANIGKYISDGAVNMLNASINFVSNFIIVFVCFIYFLSDMDKIRNDVKVYFRKKNKKTFKLIQNIDHETTQYFKGLCLTLVIQFFEYTLVFFLIGHPNFLLLGILSSISSLIPYFGGLVVNLIALMIAAVVSPKLLILTLIVAIIFPNIDGYIVSPKVYGKTNNISPLLTIFAVFAGGVLGGFVGILIALPLTIIIKTIFNYYKGDIYKKIDDIKEKI